MRERCNDPKSDQYKWYGAKGVTVCDRWQRSFANFLADMGERPVGKTIDRAESEGNYEPTNCRWATKQEQIWNQAKTIKVEFRGELIALTAACELLNIPLGRVYSRMKRGISFADSCTPGHLRETKTDEKLKKYAELRKIGKTQADLSQHFGLSKSGLEKWSRDAIARGWLTPRRSSLIGKVPA